jgi:hypothetical protein
MGPGFTHSTSKIKELARQFGRLGKAPEIQSLPTLLELVFSRHLHLNVSAGIDYAGKKSVQSGKI